MLITSEKNLKLQFFFMECEHSINCILSKHFVINIACCQISFCQCVASNLPGVLNSGVAKQVSVYLEILTPVSIGSEIDTVSAKEC